MEYDTEKIRLLSLKHALMNAHLYGKAVLNGVIGKVIAEYPECKKDMKMTTKIIKKVIDEVNSMSKDEIKEKMKQFEYLKKVEKSPLEKIKEHVPNAVEGKVVTRLPPEPNAAALHIGHAKAMWLDKVVAELFKGTCILRWDDTNPETEKKEFVDELKKDLEWLGITWDKEIYTSDYIPLMYQLCEKLLREGHGYVCTCPHEIISENRKMKKECECRKRSPDENLKLWNEMLEGNILPGKAVVRMKGDMKSDNTAMRDPTLFRIIDIDKTPHFRQGKKYRVWPLYDFSSAVMDSPDTVGITHPIRSKEYEIRNEPYFKLMEYLGLRKPTLITISRLSIPGYPVSKRLIKPLVEKGIVWGWDDPRLVTIKGLARRGITPKAIKEFVLQFGISTVESTPTLEKLFSENRKVVDPIALRRMFVPDPVKIKINGGPEKEVSINNHPVENLGKRIIRVTDEIYLSKEDVQNLKDGEVIRLKDLYNVKYLNNKFYYDSDEVIKDIKKIQWVPHNGIKCRVYIPKELFNEDGTVNENSIEIVEGLCEPSCAELTIDQIIQFERFGFVRFDKSDKEKQELEFIFTHT